MSEGNVGHRQQHVARLEVAVHDAFLVQVQHRACHVMRERQHEVEGGKLVRHVAGGQVHESPLVQCRPQCALHTKQTMQAITSQHVQRSSVQLVLLGVVLHVQARRVLGLSHD
jgi:hypothetical protein